MREDKELGANTLRKHDITDEKRHENTYGIQEEHSREPCHKARGTPTEKYKEKRWIDARSARGKALKMCGVINEKPHRQAYSKCTRYAGGSETTRNTLTKALVCG